MILTDILKYIKKHQIGINIAIAIFGGLLTPLMVGIWAVFTFFYDPEKNNSSDSENSKSKISNAIHHGSGFIVQGDNITIQSRDPEDAKIISELAEKLVQATSKPATETFENSYQKTQRIAQLEASLNTMTQIANSGGTLAQQARDLLKALSRGEDLPSLLPRFDNLINAYEEGSVAELIKLYEGRAVLSYDNDPRASLTAYNRIIQLDPDNIEAHQNSGLILQRLGEIKEAEKALKKSLSLAKKTGTKFKIAGCYLSLGWFEQNLRKFENAKSLHLKALDIFTELQNKQGIAGCYYNLGIVEQNLRKFENAKKLYQKALDISIELQNKQGIASCYQNLGIVEQNLGKFEDAKSLHLKALDIFTELQNKFGIANCYMSLGAVEQNLGEFEKARTLYQNSLSISIELQNKQGIAD